MIHRYVTAGADAQSWKNPSSARQLPILAALYAEHPTLSAVIIQENERFVNRQFQKIPIFSTLQTKAPGNEPEPLQIMRTRQKVPTQEILVL